MAFPPDLSASAKPPLDNAAPPSEPMLGDPAPAGSTISLAPDQLTAAGLDGLQPGDNFTVTISGTVSSAENGITGDITSASMGETEGAAEPGGDMLPAEPGFKKPKSQAFMSPKDAGMNF